MSKPRIYIAVATFLPLVGGVEMQSLVHARNLCEKGYETTIITFCHDRTWPVHEVMNGVPVIRVASTLLGRREKLPRFIQKILYVMALAVMGWKLWHYRQHYDILHVNKFSLLALPTALACKLSGKPIVIVVHSSGLGKAAKTMKTTSLVAGPLDTSTNPWLQVDAPTKVRGDLGDFDRLWTPFVLFARSLFKSMHIATVVISSRIKHYLATYDFHLPDVQLIPNGVDITCFTPFNSGTCLEERAKVVICVSRLSYEKGIDLLLQAWHLVQKQFPEARLKIVGDGPLKEQFQLMAQALGIADSVEFVGLQSDIPTQLHRGGLGVLPSRWEGMPVAVLEAMACGLPCVATRVSGSEDLIQHGCNGLLVEPEDYRGLAEALLTLLNDPELAQQYGRAARVTIEQYYSLEHITDQYIELYQCIASRQWKMVEDTQSSEISQLPSEECELI